MFVSKPTEPAKADQTSPAIHPVDRMAEIKSQIAELDREYEQLRAAVINGKASTIGNLWQATVTSITRRTITLADAQRLLPHDLFDALVKSTNQINVMLHRRKTPKPIKPNLAHSRWKKRHSPYKTWH